ncbi:MAG TPA: Trk system potassium transporter TrkA [Clostridia bacterium]|nr:Trk system potassium transporter TrkA [Clostridia bacterium]
MRSIIIGAGKVGYSIAQMLSLENHDVVLIEKDEERRRIVDQNLDVQTIGGNGASLGVLKQAGVAEADLVIAVTEADELNMIACLIAKSFGVPRTVARVRNPEYMEITEEEALGTFGVDLIINPERVAAQLIAKLIKFPEAANVEYYAQGSVQLLELRLSEKAPIVSTKLRDLRLPHRFLIVAILRNEKMIIPRGDDILYPEDLIFIIAKTTEMLDIEKLLGTTHTDIKSVIILGGGRLGIYLASLLEKKNLSVKIIDKDLSQCHRCVENLQNVLVINGDGTDLTLLEEEDTGTTDLFVAATGDDKVNLLVSLLAKHLGAKKTIAQIRRSDYATLVEKVGVDITVSPRILTASAILKFIRKGDIVSVTLLGGAKAEMLEFIAPENSKVVNKPLRVLKFPVGAIIGAIGRQQKVIIPSGDDLILPGDHVIVFALPEAIKKVEHFFQEP